MAQRAVGDILHGAALLRAQCSLLPPHGGEFGIKAATVEYSADDMRSEALGAFHVQGILCGLDIQAVARMEGGAGKKRLRGETFAAGALQFVQPQRALSCGDDNTLRVRL